MTTETVRKLYITLRRSFAGTRETQCRTLQSLGLRYREQTVVQENTESVRGAILKVRTISTESKIAAGNLIAACHAHSTCLS